MAACLKDRPRLHQASGYKIGNAEVVNADQLDFKVRAGIATDIARQHMVNEAQLACSGEIGSANETEAVEARLQQVRVKCPQIYLVTFHLAEIGNHIA